VKSDLIAPTGTGVEGHGMHGTEGGDTMLPVTVYPARLGRGEAGRPTTPSQALYLVRDPHRSAEAAATGFGVRRPSPASAPGTGTPLAAPGLGQPAATGFAAAPQAGQRMARRAQQDPPRRWWWPFGRRGAARPIHCNRCGGEVGTGGTCRLGHRDR
jgi:hypothetical protein